jgi:hypothetical protein
MTTPTAQQRLADYDAHIAKLKKELSDKAKSIDYKDPGTGEPNKSFQVWLKKQGGPGAKELPQDIKALLKQARTKSSDKIEQKLREHYLEFVCTDTKPIFDQLAGELTKLTKSREKLDGSIPGSFIFTEMPQPRDTFVMQRGQYTKPGDRVAPNTPAILPPLKKAGDRATRLDLARWLVSPEQPLTARVAVNRFWQQLFGTGLSKSSSDFGTQGEMPSHPELLDWLAVWYRENRWDTKALLRQIVTSAAFRQDSKATPDLLRRDPENRLLARGPRLRLDAEQIRDNALFVSGLINLEMGGRGVRPYQPPRIWEPVAYTGSNTKDYVPDKGKALYRRSLYTFFKRTAPPPFLTNFDVPNRESSCGRRERSNTPLQALQLMNDVQHFEAARALAERLMTEGGPSADERIAFGYRAVLSRRPDANEAIVVRQVLDQYLSRYRADVEAAKQAIRVGESQPRADLPEPELAAYTLIANLLLNLDETVTRN